MRSEGSRAGIWRGPELVAGEKSIAATVLFVVFCFLCIQIEVCALPSLEARSIAVDRLRCEYLTDPLGVDVLQPRLSWIVKSDERGQRQTAYRIVVSSSIELLESSRGDLWDTGRIYSDETAQIPYRGRPLASRQWCYWKVMVWDSSGNPSEWSEPSFWLMGLLRKQDWEADWITLRDTSQRDPIEPAYGYLSWREDSPDVEKSIVVDLGRAYPIDSLQLWPAGGRSPEEGPGFYTYGWMPKIDGFLFPTRFRIETAMNTDFSDRRIVVDETAADVSPPGLKVLGYRLSPVVARYVRLTVTRLATRDPSNFSFALAEIMVFSKGHNVAEGALVKADDAVQTGGWSTEFLVDGCGPSRYGSLDVSSKPVLMVRKEFELPSGIRRATVSVTGLGYYQLRINGNRVGDQILAPEWTRFTETIQYQTYDVTNLLEKGLNAVGAQIAGGWWTGPLALEGPLKNPEYCLIMRLDVELEDGSHRVITTDSSWIATDEGPIQRAGIYYGEVYDATREIVGWDKSRFVGRDWRPVTVIPYPEQSHNASLVAQPNEPIKAVMEIVPETVTEPSPGVYVFDMGQNMVGWCAITLDAPRGDTIVLQHAEILREDGDLYTDNLRGASQVNIYVLPGGAVTLEPHFTYHGFRYVRLTGFSGDLKDVRLVGKVIHSASPEAGKFHSSEELVNSIMHCAVWSQRGNMHSAPTDCPQRTERFGWLGDMHAFAQTSIYNMDMAGFLTKWIGDIRDSQLDDGRFPNLAPHPSDTDWLKWYNAEYGPAWSDAGVVIPWLVYLNYGDKRILELQYEPATRWIKFIYESNLDLIWRHNRGGDYGDWLNGSMTALEEYPRRESEVPKDLFATAFFAHSVDLVSRMAKVLGYQEDAARYEALYADIKEAFSRTFVSPDGRITGDTQAGYALALNLNLISDSLRPRVTSYLLDAIVKYKNHLSTGMQTTHRMMLELTRNGHHDEAWRIISDRSVPSWGHMVEMGATTMWERWDGYLKNGKLQSPNMNSFNHMAFGAVGEWIWKSLVGINLDENNPGYKHFMIRPRTVEQPLSIRGEYATIRGTIVCDWKKVDSKFNITLEIPTNTTATVHVPAKKAGGVREGGKRVKSASHVVFIGMQDGCAVYRVSSGKYSFASVL